MNDGKGLLAKASKLLRLCGNGEQNNWSVRMADYFFVDCACCIFWRGTMFGGIIGTVLGIVLSCVLLAIWRH